MWEKTKRTFYFQCSSCRFCGSWNKQNIIRMSRKLHVYTCLTLILLTWIIGWAPNNARKWQMGFNSAFKVLIPKSGLSKKAIVIEKSVFFENTQIMRRILRIHRSPIFSTHIYQCFGFKWSISCPLWPHLVYPSRYKILEAITEQLRQKYYAINTIPKLLCWKYVFKHGKYNQACRKMFVLYNARHFVIRNTLYTASYQCTIPRHVNPRPVGREFHQFKHSYSILCSVDRASRFNSCK
jgi:hypothetical protein